MFYVRLAAVVLRLQFSTAPRLWSVWFWRRATTARSTGTCWSSWPRTTTTPTRCSRLSMKLSSSGNKDRDNYLYSLTVTVVDTPESNGRKLSLNLDKISDIGCWALLPIVSFMKIRQGLVPLPGRCSKICVTLREVNIGTFTPRIF